jgi:hypothetical protein
MNMTKQIELTTENALALLDILGAWVEDAECADEDTRIMPNRLAAAKAMLATVEAVVAAYADDDDGAVGWSPDMYVPNW